MTLWMLPLLPVVVGAGLWALGARVAADRRPVTLGTVATGALGATTAAAAWAALTDPTATYGVGAGLVLRVVAGPIAGPAAVLVAAVTGVVVAYAAVHEEPASLPRLLGLLTVFGGTMLLLVLADDLITLTVAWELVGALSWALIGHDWRDPDAPRAAAHAFNATRFGGLGLFLAAGATFAGAGSLSFDALGVLDGAPLHVAAAGILLAAVSKSAQVPFAPWLFSAMAGPTPVSALLHSSTMVAAGAYALIRLQPVLDHAGWFAPTTIAIGLATALAAGLVAALQGHAKKLLAGSTSAQYGLMLVAVGAGYPTVAALHLATHAVVKSQLFLSAGMAIEAVGSPSLPQMRLGSRLPGTARLTLVASLGLAAVPPLGAAFTKEQVLAAAAHETAWLGVLVVAAGGLSALYATRFQVLAFGTGQGGGDAPRELVRNPHRIEITALAVLAAGSLAFGALWLPAVHEAAADLLTGRLPAGKPWELIASLGVVGLAVYGTWATDRSGRLGHVPLPGRQRTAADWLGLPGATRRVVVDPTLAAAAALARFDDRVVDAGVRGAAAVGRVVSRVLSRSVEITVDAAVGALWRTGRRIADGSARLAEGLVDGAVDGVAWLTGRAGEDARRTQTGFVHHQYVVIAIGLALVALTAVLGR